MMAVAATEAATSLSGVTVDGGAVHHSLKSVVREGAADKATSASPAMSVAHISPIARPHPKGITPGAMRGVNGLAAQSVDCGGSDLRPSKCGSLKMSE